VIAGRAAPSAEIAIIDGDTEIGRVRANQAGDWAFTSETPLPPGPRALTLTERTADGREIGGDGTVFLVVPGKPIDAAANRQDRPPASALAVLTQPAGPPRLLQSTTPGSTQLGLAAVDYGEHGELQFAGTAHPGTTVRLYIDNHLAAEATTNPNGLWAVAPRGETVPGLHRLRIDELRGSGSVAARVELPFTREPPRVSAMTDGSTVVQPGQNLWRMARYAYGTGVRYSVIYQANREQIRDPNLIYPGQVLAMPAEGDEPVTPASSSRSR